MLEKEELQYASSRMDFWEKLDETQRVLLEESVSRISWPDGYNLYNSDRECLGLILVKSGGVRTYILSEDGKEVTLYRLGPGELCVLSASCILDNITFDVHMDAEGDTQAYLIHASVFGRLCSQNVYVQNFAYRKTIERFSDVMWAMEQILFMSFDKRLAIFLLDEMQKTGSEDLKLTQEQIAKYIGSAREVVSRMLKVFQKEGIIEQSRGTIRIVDRAKLKERL